MDGTVELICMIIRVGIQCAAQLIPCIVPIVRSCYMLPVWYFANLSFCHFAIFHWDVALELIHWKVTTLHIYAGVHWSGLHWKVNCVAQDLIGSPLKGEHSATTVNRTGWGQRVGVGRMPSGWSELTGTVIQCNDERLTEFWGWPLTGTVMGGWLELWFDSWGRSPVIVGFNSHLPWFARVRRDLICFPVS